MNGVKAILGMQWGDEGNGKFADILTQDADIVVRFQGGNNAGHTIVINGKIFKLHHLPAAVLSPDKIAVIGNGTVINPQMLLQEIDNLRANGVTVNNLLISDRAHVIMPWHIREDEESESGSRALGSTKRGIGPAYSDKISRNGMTVGEFIDSFIEENIDSIYPKTELFDCARRLKPYIADTVNFLHEQYSIGKKIVLEGAQGTLLDIDHGTYPYVTSSSTTIGGACTGTGLPASSIKDVIGIVKAYSTRVGLGPFPTEEKVGPIKDHLVKVGNEFGTTTGRQRRVGWLDTVALNYAMRINGVTELVITKLDVLGGLSTIKVATTYLHDGKKIINFPSTKVLDNVEPQYVEFPGWNQFTDEEKNYILKNGINALPREAREYLDFISKSLNVKISMVSIGPGREETLAFPQTRTGMDVN